MGLRSSVRYSIYSGDPEDLFSIDLISGNLRTASLLDHETRQSVLLNVIIVIEDVNDNGPEFDSSSVRISVPENAELGIPLYAAHARDKDSGRNGAVRYKLASSPGTEGLFVIDPRQGHITLSRPLDYETTQRHSLVLTASDSGDPPRSANLTVLVEVQDVNDNPPVFERMEYAISVLESLPVNSQVIQVTAVDLDTGNNARLTYRLFPSNNLTVASTPRDDEKNQEVFGVFPNSGWLYLRRALDREVGTPGSDVSHRLTLSCYFQSRDRYVVRVVASDNGSPSGSATARVVVTVLDANDNDPKFSQDSYEFWVEENRVRGTTVGQVKATDPDLESNGALRYSIIPSNSSFQINPNTGEFMTGYYLFVYSACYRSDVPNLGSMKPTEIFKLFLSASDRLTFWSLRHKRRDQVATPKKRSHRRFQICRGVRVASLTPSHMKQCNTLERLGRSVCVAATKKTGPKLTHEVASSPRVVWTLLLKEEDVTGTRLGRYEQLMSEIGKVGRVGGLGYRRSGTIEHMEHEMKHLYVCKTQSFCTKRQTLEHDLGVNHIGSEARLMGRVLKLMDYALMSYANHILTGYLRVGGPRTMFTLDAWKKPCAVTCSVTEKIVLYRYLRCAAMQGDGWTMAVLIYHLGTVNKLCIPLVTPVAGEISTHTPLDRELRPQHELVVEARDQGSPQRSSRVAVRIKVSDVNDNAPDLVDPREDVVSVREEQPPGTEVVRVRAVDRDLGENASVKYSLLKGRDSDGHGVFTVDALSGVVRTTTVLDHEDRAIYRLAVAATDGGDPPQQTVRLLRVEVLDLNDNRPTFTSSSLVFRNDMLYNYLCSVNYRFFFSLPSRMRTPTLVVRHTVYWCYRDQPFQRANLKVNEASVKVTAPALDLDEDEKTLIRNKLFDSYKSYCNQVREDVRVGHVVGTVATSDPDHSNHVAGGQVTYTLTSVNSSEEEGAEPEDNSVLSAFDMDRTTGSLVVARELDRETRSVYRLEVRALDTSASNNPQSSAVSVRVEVADVNDNPPRWLQDPITLPVSEDTLIGSPVWNFSATDADFGPNGEVRYRLVKQWPDAGEVFTVDPLTGTLTLRDRLDYESTKEYHLVIRAMDQAMNESERLSTTVTTRVLVRDSNDNPPVFLSPSTPVVHVGEDTLVGYPLCHVIASDRDSGENGRVTYDITGGNDEGWFVLDRSTGVLTLARSLGNGGTYVLNVTASDHGAPVPQRASKAIRIVVQGAKDNPPRFIHQEYHANVSEDAVVGSFVVKVTARSIASDAAVGGGNLTYSVPPGAAEDRFTVDARSGVVSVRAPLDRETRDRYALPVYVSNGAHAHGDLATVWVRVTDVNDNPPVFRPGACYPLAVPENSDLAVIHTVVAVDKDIEGNGEITYTIAGGNVGNRFSLDPHTGELKSRPLDRESLTRYWLLVMAQDRGSPAPLRASCNISVLVEDQNDNDPVFAQPRYLASVAEDAPPGTAVLTVHATDADLGPNARLVYSLANESDWMFQSSLSIILEQSRLGDILILSQRYYSNSQRSCRDVLRLLCSKRVRGICLKTPDPRRKHIELEISCLTHIGTQLSPQGGVEGDEKMCQFRITLLHVGAPLNPLPTYSPGGLRRQTRCSRPLDHERQSSYSFQVVAMDGGRYDARSQRVPVQVTVTDVNDNKPVFTKFPFTARVPAYTQPGHTLVRVTAEDADEGTNSEVVFSLVNEPLGGKFRINPNTGAISAASSLTPESGRLFRLQVLARDKGNPPQSSTGLVEVRVGEGLEGATQLRFQNNSYHVDILENSPPGTEVIQVSAVRTDGRRQRISYSLGSGNEDSIFDVDPGSGMVQVRDSRGLDYEQSRELRLAVVAETEGPLFGYCEVVVHLQDYNDNPPYFTQPQYSAAVWEGNNKGTFVMQDVSANCKMLTAKIFLYSLNSLPMKIGLSDNPTNKCSFLQVTATDADETSNSQVLYHIVDGNHDNAFVIEPPFSGLVKTNIVLDREIRDTYKLTVIATDEGVPQLTGTSTLRISIVDVNDNPPTFPPHSVISVSEVLRHLSAVFVCVNRHGVTPEP
uniref:Cadherin domain-containing protein n=1 Tax=Timema douglasi TaxID=61478 RepID=A0A7R8VHV5_TIMDO|nr:unnamed protein product [Timema douglasi]